MMMDGWFKLGEHWSEEFQMYLTGRPEKRKAQRIFTLDEVPGVNKLVSSDKGYYTNAEQTLECFYISPTLDSIQYVEDSITDALDTRGQYVDFIPYYDPAYVYSVIVINEPTFKGDASYMRGVSFSFDLSIAPFKKRIGGTKIITLTKNMRLYNPEKYPSDPKLKIYGNGNVNIFINNRKTTFLNVENVIEIDSDPDVMEVFKEESGVLINQHQKFVRQNFPILDPGFNDISWNGNVTKIELEPRWQTKI